MMALFLRSMVLVATLVFSSTSAPASYCSEPTPPTCATRYGTFDDQDDFDQCKRKMTYFKTEVETFLSCVRDEAEQARNGYNSAVEAFNRRARG
jgi:hypothetical protein